MCAWTRIPSIFHSTAAGLIRARASSIVAALEASIGPIGRPTCSPNFPSPALPSARAVSATAPMEPDSIRARRTAAPGTWAARAIASAITPSSAP